MAADINEENGENTGIPSGRVLNTEAGSWIVAKRTAEKIKYVQNIVKKLLKSKSKHVYRLMQP